MGYNTYDLLQNKYLWKGGKHTKVIRCIVLHKIKKGKIGSFYRGGNQ